MNSALNENTNGLVRQYLKKRSSFLSVTDNNLIDIMNKLNTRPRKTLGYKTPSELFICSKKARAISVINLF